MGASASQSGGAETRTGRISYAGGLRKFKDDTSGKNADYIPYLAQVDSKLFGIAIVSADNQVFTLGDVDYSFSIQSISKLFSLALAMKELGPDKVSWSEVAKYVVASPESTRAVADVLNRYPDRFLFGTDEVAPPNQEQYLRVYYQYESLWKLLDAEAIEKVRKGNYERLFDEARQKVRAWELSHTD